MIKILDSKNKNFDNILDNLLSKRKNKIQFLEYLIDSLMNMMDKHESF